MNTPKPKQAPSAAATPPRRRSSAGADGSFSATSSNSSTASQRAALPYGLYGSWNWGKAQPNKRRLPILDITLTPSKFAYSSSEDLAIVTAEKTFGISDFGHGGPLFRSALYALERELRSAKSSGRAAPPSIVAKFRRKYPKVKFNEYYATLVLNKNMRANAMAQTKDNPAKQPKSVSESFRQSPSTGTGATSGPQAGVTGSPVNRRASTTSLSGSSANSNSSTESFRAKLPFGPEGSAAWGRAQPKKRVSILDIVLAKRTGQYSYGHDLIFRTAKKDFCDSDFGFFDAPFKSDLYALKRILEGAQAFGATSPLNIVQMFIKQYPKIKYNSAYAGLVKNPKFSVNEDHVVTFLESQFCGRQHDLLHEAYGGIASVTEGPANIPPSERRIVRVDLLPLNASGRDSTSLRITTYDGNNELLKIPQADFQDQQDAAILKRLLRNMKEAATYRDAGGILRKTARRFVDKYPRVDIVAKRLVGSS